jgi:hypothetical protein
MKNHYTGTTPSTRCVSPPFPNDNRILSAHLVIIAVVEEVVGRQLLVLVAGDECLNDRVTVKTEGAQLWVTCQ